METRRRRGLLTSLTYLCLLSHASCTGEIGKPRGDFDPRGSTTGGGGSSSATGGTGDPQPPGGSACKPPGAKPGRSPLRRLNRAEYRNTLHALFPTLTS